MVEHSAVNRRVAGSSPARGASIELTANQIDFVGTVEQVVSVATGQYDF